MIVPDGHDEHHSSAQRLAHCCETALSGEFVRVAKGSLLRGAERIGDGVSGDACDT